MCRSTPGVFFNHFASLFAEESVIWPSAYKSARAASAIAPREPLEGFEPVARLLLPRLL